MTVHSLVWLRDDLRLADNPAFHAAVSKAARVTAVYVHEQAPGLRPLGGAASWWLGKSLGALAGDLAACGIEVLVQAGDPGQIVPDLAQRLGVSNVVWNRRYAPAARNIDAGIKSTLRAGGIAATSFAGNVLVEPWEVRTGTGTPFQVYTPFAKVVRQSQVAFPLPNPLLERAAPLDDGVVAAGIVQPKWSSKFEQHWLVGEAGAREVMVRFFEGALDEYIDDRDRPDRQGTSALSPHLRFGEISARQVWHAARMVAEENPAKASVVEKFLSELIWRDFNYHQLYHRPDIACFAMRDSIAGLEPDCDDKALAAWAHGRTGIPIVDAGMRQLWQTGWMHNRVRMLVASFLTKNMNLDWRQGEGWFWDTLVDADMASNPGNWQWVAGCGMDAAPYFRIFNPVVQGQRFDPGGAYVRHWLPELASLTDAWIHRPFDAPAQVLADAGIVLGDDYPRPRVDLATSHRRARERFAALK